MRSATSWSRSATWALAFFACATAMSAAMATAPRPEPARPNATPVAVYVSPATLKARQYNSAASTLLEPGKVFADALDSVGREYFPQLHLVPSMQPARYALAVGMDPEWSRSSGKLELTLHYVVQGADGTRLAEGSVKPETARLSNFNAVIEKTTALAIRQAMAQIQRRLAPDPARLEQASTATIDYTQLVDRDKPLRTGTGFFINRDGQLLAADHVVRECMVLEARTDTAVLPLQLRTSNTLLDVAVLDSGRVGSAALPLRRDPQIVLGEPAIAISHPAGGHAGDASNVARGNISAGKGPRGSHGMFQFSAPSLSGNGGSPVVSEQGELLGMTTGVRDSAFLAKQGLIPENVDLVLDARHLARFMQREQIRFETVAPQAGGSLQVATQAALPSTVQINCYQ